MGDVYLAPESAEDSYILPKVHIEHLQCVYLCVSVF